MMIRGSSARCYACGQSQEESCGTCTRVATATALPSRLLSVVLQKFRFGAAGGFSGLYSTSLVRQGDAPEPLQA
jgi:hypothetical protein